MRMCATFAASQSNSIRTYSVIRYAGTQRELLGPWQPQTAQPRPAPLMLVLTHVEPTSPFPAVGRHVCVPFPFRSRSVCGRLEIPPTRDFGTLLQSDSNRYELAAGQ